MRPLFTFSDMGALGRIVQRMISLRKKEDSSYNNPGAQEDAKVVPMLTPNSQHSSSGSSDNSAYMVDKLEEVPVEEDMVITLPSIPHEPEFPKSFELSMTKDEKARLFRQELYSLANKHIVPAYTVGRNSSGVETVEQPSIIATDVGSVPSTSPEEQNWGLVEFFTDAFSCSMPKCGRSDQNKATGGFDVMNGLLQKENDTIAAATGLLQRAPPFQLVPITRPTTGQTTIQTTTDHLIHMEVSPMPTMPRDPFLVQDEHGRFVSKARRSWGRSDNSTISTQFTFEGAQVNS
jgi:hypothetical protein